MKKSSAIASYLVSFGAFWGFNLAYWALWRGDLEMGFYAPFMPLFAFQLLFVEGPSAVAIVVVGLVSMVILAPVISIVHTLRHGCRKRAVVISHGWLLLYYLLAFVAALAMMEAVTNPV